MQTSLTEQDTQELARPVFVDPSGRRRRIVRRVALGVCALLVCYGAVLVAALLGAPIPQSALLPVPVAPAPQPTQVDVAPPPDASVSQKPKPVATATTPPRTSQASPRSSPVNTTPVVQTPVSAPGGVVERPNSNAASQPPGLVRHSETRNRGNGNG